MSELEKQDASSDFNDSEILATIGYKPELKRNFSTVQMFGIAFSLMGLIPSMASTLAFSLQAGPYGMVWGWFTCSICIMTVGLSLAELGSALPTSGGLYWWSYHFAPAKAKRPLSFLAGYSSFLGATGGLMSIDYGFAQMLVSMIIVATDGAWNPSAYVLYGIFAACVVSHACVGSMGTKHLAKLQTVCIYGNFAIVIVLIIALPIGARNHLNSGSFMFGKVENLTDGWPTAWVFFLAWLSPSWTIGGFDSCIHMAEEASNAAKAVPFGIIASISVGWLFGFVVVIVLVAVMPHDVKPLLETVYQQPFAQLVYDTLGKNWTIGIMTVIFVLQWTMGLSSITSASRQAWAFSRDGALPFSKFFKIVNERYSSPIRCVWGSALVALCIGCLCMINSAAAQALFELSAGGVSMSWLIPIALKLFYGRGVFVPGPFYLGKIPSLLIGGFATLFLVFSIVLIQFPQTTAHPTKDTMNYTCVIVGTVWIGCLAYYYLFAHRWYNGPKTTLEGVELEGVEYSGDGNKTEKKLDVSSESFR
ncbi:GABA-specific permease [Yarrowia sp. B02]|nr:GABA-specific permease [Yarrowia sp. B02]